MDGFVDWVELGDEESFKRIRISESVTLLELRDMLENKYDEDSELVQSQHYMLKIQTAKGRKMLVKSDADTESLGLDGESLIIAAGPGAEKGSSRDSALAAAFAAHASSSVPMRPGS